MSEATPGDCAFALEVATSAFLWICLIVLGVVFGELLFRIVRNRRGR